MRNGAAHSPRTPGRSSNGTPCLSCETGRTRSSPGCPSQGASEMIERSVKRLKMRALVVDDELGEPTAEGRAVRALVQELQGREIEVIEAVSAEDGTSVITSDSAIHALLIDWTLGEDGHDRARA